MLCLKRNKQTIYYRLYTAETPILDAGGYDSGEVTNGYGDPVAISVNVSPARGSVSVEKFGNELNYDRVIVTDDMSCPISEGAILYVDVPTTGPHDYIVKRVAKSLNCISIAIARVEVSQ